MSKFFSKTLLLLALVVCTGQMYGQTQKVITDYGSKKTFDKGVAITALEANTGADVANPNQYGTLNIVAGSGTNSSTNNANPLNATFANPLNLEFDDDGNIFITENGSPGKIRAIKASDNAVITITTPPNNEFNFTSINGIAIFNQKIYVVSEGSNTIRYANIPPDITTAFTFNTATLPEGISSSISDLAIDSTSLANEPIFYILDNKTSIKRVQLNLTTNTVTTLTDITIPTPTPTLSGANQLRVMANKDIYLANRSRHLILKYTFNAGDDSYSVATLAGVASTARPNTDNFVYNSPYLQNPIDVAVGEQNKVYFSEYNGTRIRVYDPNSPDKVLTVIGQNTGATSVNNTVGYAARGNGHFGIRIKDGYLYFVQRDGRRITRVDISSGKFPYTISPALPEGLVFNNYNGEITGTPTAISPLTTYTVTTYDNNGDIAGTANVEIEVVDVLPVTLKSFEAKKQTNGNVTLTWATTSENNNSHFLVYKSTDGINFTELTRKTSVSEQGGQYNFTDVNVSNGINYYKLVQVDNDGQSEELGIKVIYGGLNDSSWTVYPNPSNGEKINIQYNGSAVKKGIKIYDITGKLVDSQQITLDGQTTVTLSQSLPKGIYTLVVEDLGVQKIIIQ